MARDQDTARTLRRLMRIYTRKGDDGTTGLLYGGRVRKDGPAPAAYGEVDEAQAVLGVARAECTRGGELDELLVTIERDLWVLMAELATDPSNRHKLVADASLVTDEMVERLERTIDDLSARFEPPTAFVDVARTVVRRAERRALTAAGDESRAVHYLNRLSDLLWTMARWQEGESLLSKESHD